MKPTFYFLVLEIGRDGNKWVTVKQSAYTKIILERFGMQDCNSVSTPIIKEGIQLRKEVREELSSSFFYREAVGALMHLMTEARPDIACVFNVVSRKLESPIDLDVANMKRIFRYLRGTMEFGFIYKSEIEHQLQSYSDADHGGNEITRPLELW